MTKRTPEALARAGQVAELLIAGLGKRDLQKWVTDKSQWTPAPTERQLSRYVADATQLIQERAEKQADQQLSLAINRLEMLFSRCLLVQDFKGALACQKELDQLLNLSTAGRRGPGRTDRPVLKLRGSWRAGTEDAKEDEKTDESGGSLIRLA